MECEAYQRAVEAYYRRHMCRVWPRPDCFARARQGMGLQVYNAMWGPYELQVTGNLRDYDRSARAHEITVPTLLMCGRYDCTTPEETARYHGLVAGSEYVVFEQSAHFPYVEEPEQFRRITRDFLRRVERERRLERQH
jgi:proline iminopeptidase